MILSDVKIRDSLALGDKMPITNFIFTKSIIITIGKKVILRDKHAMTKISLKTKLDCITFQKVLLSVLIYIRNGFNILYRVLPRTNQANHVLCTEIRFLNGSFQNLKMLPQPSFQISNLPLLRALKRGTV